MAATFTARAAASPPHRAARLAGLTIACAAIACSEPTGTEALDLLARAERGEVIAFELAQVGTQRQAPFVTLELACAGELHVREEIVEERFVFGPGNDVRWERHVRSLRRQGDGPTDTTDVHTVRIGTFSGQWDQNGPYVLLGLRQEDQYDWFGVELRPRGRAYVFPQTVGGACPGDPPELAAVDKIFLHR